MKLDDENMDRGIIEQEYYGKEFYLIINTVKQSDELTRSCNLS